MNIYFELSATSAITNELEILELSLFEGTGVD
jgi:hypothetical protein